ncbi:MAG: Rpn family recombination-promoting nuclease/putative transposase [Pirellulales bacterium]
MPLGIKPTVDFAFKKIFGSTENVRTLIGLLNAILELPAPITDVEILNPFNYQEFVGDKQIILDIRARDSTGRWLNIEMQVSVVNGLPERLVYYACSLYVDQLGSGSGYVALQPAISICLLSDILFRDTDVAHHRFRLYDGEAKRELGDMVEVHMVELPKYNLLEATITASSKIEQWAFFLLHADRYDPDRLRALLPGVEFDQAITVIEAISQKTEDRTMYDQREKALRDQQWLLEGARQEGLERGLEKGLEKGREEARGVLVDTVATLQRIAEVTVTDAEELKKLAIDDLSRLCTELQSRLRTRGSS